MDVGTDKPDPTIWNANLRALRQASPESAGKIIESTPPSNAQLVLGRDREPTWFWTDADGTARWLGRTSMPSISAAALIDAFDPGMGNVLLRGIGSGAEAGLLLQRLAAHQAVVVLEDDPRNVNLVLQLRDFSDAIRAGRLVLIVGDDAWNELGRFLIEHDGYLTPERVLAWPWFAPPDVSEVTSRLHDIGASVAQRRSQVATTAPSNHTSGSTARVAIVSNLTDPRVFDLANQIAQGCASLEWPNECLVLDSPTRVHPRRVERELAHFEPNLILVLGVLPPALPYRLPPAAIAVICIHEHSLSRDWLLQLPHGASLVTSTLQQHEQAVSAGIPAESALMPPSDHQTWHERLQSIQATAHARLAGAGR